MCRDARALSTANGGLGVMWILDWLLASIIAGVVGYIFWTYFIKKHLGGTEES
jgi:hypothetical protein